MYSKQELMQKIYDRHGKTFERGDVLGEFRLAIRRTFRNWTMFMVEYESFVPSKPTPKVVQKEVAEDEAE